MAKIGDRVEVKSTSGTRAGKVTSVSGPVLRVLWDTGEETSIAPAAGVLTIVPRSIAKRPAPAKKTVAKKATASRSPAKAASRSTKASAPVATEAPPPIKVPAPKAKKNLKKGKKGKGDRKKG